MEKLTTTCKTMHDSKKAGKDEFQDFYKELKETVRVNKELIVKLKDCAQEAAAAGKAAAAASAGA